MILNFENYWSQSKDDHVFINCRWSRLQPQPQPHPHPIPLTNFSICLAVSEKTKRKDWEWPFWLWWQDQILMAAKNVILVPCNRKIQKFFGIDSFHPSFLAFSCLPSLRSFIHSFTHIHSFIQSFTHPFTHSSIHPFIHPFIHSFIHSFIHLFIYSFIHSFIHYFVHSFNILFCKPWKDRIPGKDWAEGENPQEQKPAPVSIHALPNTQSKKI